MQNDLHTRMYSFVLYYTYMIIAWFVIIRQDREICTLYIYWKKYNQFFYFLRLLYTYFYTIILFLYYYECSVVNAVCDLYTSLMSTL